MSWLITGTYKGAAVSDADAQAYLRAVEQADNQGPLEQGVQQAVNQFVIGCKADGIWNAIKASCILAGARTLTGALVPLVGSAPTNVNGLFVEGDYNRTTGLVGDGSTKYLNSNRAVTADLQTNNHISVFMSSVDSFASGTFANYYLSSPSTTPTRAIGRRLTPSTQGAIPDSNSFVAVGASPPASGFLGMSRNSSTQATVRTGSSNTTVTADIVSPITGNMFVFSRGSDRFVNARLAFYSIGESLNLALLDARVTTLVNALAAVIP